MARDANFHTRAVVWLKIFLPLSALALLSTLFLFARSPANQEQTLPFAQIQEIANEHRITAPQFSGVTDNGALVVVKAQSAQPDDDRQELLKVVDIHITLNRPSGRNLQVTARESVIDTSAQTARLNGLARIVTSDGYQVETTGLSANLKTGEIETDGAMAAQVPFGSLTAGKMHVALRESGIGQRLLFTQGVRLLYRPPAQ